MDPQEPHWRVNSSFSPPISRRWNHRRPLDESSPSGVQDARVYGSSPLSLLSKGSRSIAGSEYMNHQHSASDGQFSYMESPYGNLHAPRRAPSFQRFDHDEFSTPTGGMIHAGPSNCPRPGERHFGAANSFRSSSPFSEYSPLGSATPIRFTPRSHPRRRPFMSKPVYPLVFRNPVSESDANSVMADTNNDSRMTPSNDGHDSPAWPRISPDRKFRRVMSESHKHEASPELDMSSRREGFRWSNASSYDFGFDGDFVDFSDQMSVESQRCTVNTVKYLKCGLCERYLWQKSPWSSNRIVRSTDMPVAGVLPCRHVFHADCLEETTPKGQTNEPPCPLCIKAGNSEAGGSTSFSEPLQVALRSVRRKQHSVTFASGDNQGATSSSSLTSSQPVTAAPRGGSFFRNRLKKRFPFKVKSGKDLFGCKVSRKGQSSSSPSSAARDNPGSSGS